MPVFPTPALRAATDVRAAEPVATYLARSGAPVAEEVRRLINDWANAYPPEHLADLSARLRDSDDRKHDAAFFELVLYRMLSQLGHSVVVHPCVPDTETLPDFATTSVDGQVVYVEAVRATNTSDEAQAAERRFAQFVDGLNECGDRAHMFIASRVGGVGPVPSKKRVGYEVDRQLAEAHRHSDGSADFKVSVDGWSARVHAMPRPSGAISGRPFFGVVRGPWVDTTTRAMRGALDRKAKKYGKIEKPYVIAMACPSFGGAHEDLIDVLFGSVRWTFEVSDAADDPAAERIADGFWTSGGRPRNRNVTGILAVRRAGSMSLGQAEAALYVNPWAEHPLPDSLLGVSAYEASTDDSLRAIPGRSILEMLGVPPGWPDL